MKTQQVPTPQMFCVLAPNTQSSIYLALSYMIIFIALLYNDIGKRSVKHKLCTSQNVRFVVFPKHVLHGLGSLQLRKKCLFVWFFVTLRFPKWKWKNRLKRRNISNKNPLYICNAMLIFFDTKFFGKYFIPHTNILTYQTFFSLPNGNI